MFLLIIQLVQIMFWTHPTTTETNKPSEVTRRRQMTAARFDSAPYLRLDDISGVNFKTSLLELNLAANAQKQYGQINGK